MDLQMYKSQVLLRYTYVQMYKSQVLLRQMYSTVCCAAAASLPQLLLRPRRRCLMMPGCYGRRASGMEPSAENSNG
eukprot:COSAG06_NODE_38795_length_419_cov_2.684375_1_plen_75_part_10